MEPTPPIDDESDMDDLLRVRMTREMKNRLKDRARSQHRDASSHTRFLIERDLTDDEKKAA